MADLAPALHTAAGRPDAWRVDGQMTSPAELVRGWFDAYAAGDLDRASALFGANAVVAVAGTRLCGFSEVMAWYKRRADAEGPGFGYELLDLLSGDRHAAAVLQLHRGDGTSWRQVALYETDGRQITAISAFEDEHPTHQSSWGRLCTPLSARRFALRGGP